MLILASAMSVFSLPGHSQIQVRADDAARCHAALELKFNENVLTLPERVRALNAMDWFSSQGRQAGAEIYSKQHVTYEKAFEKARLNGDPRYGNAVTGCLQYYNSKTGK